MVCVWVVTRGVEHRCALVQSVHVGAIPPSSHPPTLLSNLSNPSLHPPHTPSPPSPPTHDGLRQRLPQPHAPHRSRRLWHGGRLTHLGQQGAGGGEGEGEVDGENKQEERRLESGGVRGMEMGRGGGLGGGLNGVEWGLMGSKPTQSSMGFNPLLLTNIQQQHTLVSLLSTITQTFHIGTPDLIPPVSASAPRPSTLSAQPHKPQPPPKQTFKPASRLEP